MTYNTGTESPQLGQSLTRLKSVVTALEGRLSELIERSGQSEDLHERITDQQYQIIMLKEEIASLQQDNTSLRIRLAETEKNYATLHGISRDVQGQIDTAIHDLQRLLEKETVDN